MDANKRQGTRPSKWGHQGPSFATQSLPKQSQSQPSVTSPPTPSLDQFLSGIHAERERENVNRANNAARMLKTQVALPHGIHHRPSQPGPSPPGPPQPGSQQGASFTSKNENPLWQVPPPGFVGSRGQCGSTQSDNQQGHLLVGSHRNHSNVGRNVGVQDASNCQRKAAAFPYMKSGTYELHRMMQQCPFPVDESVDHQSFCSGEGPKLLAPPRTNQGAVGMSGSETHHHPRIFPQGHRLPGPPRPPGKLFSQRFQQQQEPHPSGTSPSGQHPFGSHPPGPHPSEPHLPGPLLVGPPPTGPPPSGPPPSRPPFSGPHPSRPHPFGLPGEFSVPPPPHSYHPHQQHLQHQEQHRPGSPFSGPRPVAPHPTGRPPPGSHPQGLHPQGPHPSNPIPSGPQYPPLPPTSQKQQQQQGVAANPFSVPAPNHLAQPKHHPTQQHEFPRPGQSRHPQQAPVQEKSQREKDEDWLRDWLRRNKIGQSEEAKEKKINSISLEEGRQLIGELLQALRQLNEQRDMLSRHINRDESSWQYECRRANRTKERVVMLQARLFSKNVTNQLENRMRKIRKKRARLKRRRLENYQMQEDEEARRKEIHLKIDAELGKRLHGEQEKKREAELQEEVDKTLYEVRKKKQEASQALDLIKGLRKLRQLRKDAAQAKGVNTPRESDVSFDEKLKPLEELTSKQSVLYREEERVMQVMLEEEHEEYKEQEKQRQRKRLEEKAVKEMQAKMRLLFGKEDLVRSDDPMFPFHQFYHQAEASIHALVDIRHQWDQFLVPDTDPDGSPVPVSWVLPSDPSSAAWTKVVDT